MGLYHAPVRIYHAPMRPTMLQCSHGTLPCFRKKDTCNAQCSQMGHFDFVAQLIQEKFVLIKNAYHMYILGSYGNKTAISEFTKNINTPSVSEVLSRDMLIKN